MIPMRFLFVAPLAAALVVAAALAAPAAAQDHADHATHGSGQLPAGWALRFDPPSAHPGMPMPAPPQPTDVAFMAMGGGFHVQSGPAAIYYRDAERATGAFTLSASFTQGRSMGREAYGLVLGGDDLQESTQTYLYFLIRPADGAVLINHRTSDAAPRSLVAWTPTAAVNREAAGSGAARNELAVRVTADAVHFLVNGTEVHALTRADLGGASTDGLVGVRINHNLDLMIEGFGVTR
jgi:hypothetical protein